MNMTLNLIVALTIALIAAATQAADKPKVSANHTNQFIITGMHCDGCAGGLTAELKQTPGVVGAQVTFSNKLAVVAVDTNKITTAQLAKVIKEAGFEAKEIKP